MASGLFKAAGIAMLSLLLGACATPPKKEAKKDDGEYVWYTPTGSHIPIKVRKEQLQSTDAEKDEMRARFSDLQQRGSRAPRE